MRIDKFLKVSRILKRRTVSKELALNQRIEINGKVVKPSHEVLVGDIVGVTFGSRKMEVRVLSIQEVKNQMEITFSSLYSQHVDGVKLFESFTKISKDITIRYANQCIIVLLPKGKNDLKMAVECIEKAKESVHENR